MIKSAEQFKAERRQHAVRRSVTPRRVQIEVFDPLVEVTVRAHLALPKEPQFSVRLHRKLEAAGGLRRIACLQFQRERGQPDKKYLSLFIRLLGFRSLRCLKHPSREIKHRALLLSRRVRVLCKQLFRISALRIRRIDRKVPPGSGHVLENHSHRHALVKEPVLQHIAGSALRETGEIAVLYRL